MTELPMPSYDRETLRESYPQDDPAVAGRAEQLRADIRSAPDETAELLARGDLVDLLRRTDVLDEALNEALAAADRAEIAGTPAQQVLARLRLATVHLTRGEFADSNVLITELRAGSNSKLGPAISALIHQRSGENAFAQQHWHDAAYDFVVALALREEFGGSPDEIDMSRIALETARKRDAATS